MNHTPVPPNITPASDSEQATANAIVGLLFTYGHKGRAAFHRAAANQFGTLYNCHPDPRPFRISEIEERVYYRACWSLMLKPACWGKHLWWTMEYFGFTPGELLYWRFDRHTRRWNRYDEPSPSAYTQHALEARLAQGLPKRGRAVRTVSRYGKRQYAAYCRPI